MHFQTLVVRESASQGLASAVWSACLARACLLVTLFLGNWSCSAVSHDAVVIHPPQVKSFFLLWHPSEEKELGQVANEDFAALLQRWLGFMQGRPHWSRLVASAEACNYEAVQHGLAHALE